MKIVFPVRFSAHHGMTVQTTSLEMTDSALLLLCPTRAPAPQELVAMQLYLPDSHPPAGAIGRVRGKDSRGEGLWLDVVDTVRGVSERVRALVEWAAARVNRPSPEKEKDPSPHRAMPRYPTALPVALETAGKLVGAKARNLSASGLFVHTRADITVGSVVGVRMGLPDRDKPLVVQAKVIHHVGAPTAMPWAEPGLGLQFIDGDDAFRARIDRHVERLARLLATK